MGYIKGILTLWLFYLWGYIRGYFRYTLFCTTDLLAITVWESVMPGTKIIIIVPLINVHDNWWLELPTKMKLFDFYFTHSEYESSHMTADSLEQLSRHFWPIRLWCLVSTQLKLRRFRRLFDSVKCAILISHYQKRVD